MATVSREFDAPELFLDDNIAARAMALREGRKMPDLEHKFSGEAAEAESLSLNRQEKAGPRAIYHTAPVARRPDFLSRADAKPMTKRDINNVQLLTRDEAAEILAVVRADAPELVEQTIDYMEQQWNELLNEDERYVLTAAALRKLQRQGVI